MVGSYSSYNVLCNMVFHFCSVLFAKLGSFVPQSRMVMDAAVQRFPAAATVQLNPPSLSSRTAQSRVGLRLAVDCACSSDVDIFTVLKGSGVSQSPLMLVVPWSRSGTG